VESRKHPAKVRPVKTAVEWIFQNALIIIPIDKSIFQGRVKSNDSDGDNENRDNPLAQITVRPARFLPP
jgi:hypothetical protein